MSNRARFAVTIDQEVKAELEKRVPERQRSRFTEDALKAALRERAKEELLRMLDEGPQHTSDVDSVEALREDCEERSDYLAARHDVLSQSS